MAHKIGDQVRFHVEHWPRPTYTGKVTALRGEMVQVEWRELVGPVTVWLHESKVEPVLEGITNDTEHAAALHEVERLWEAPPGTPAFERLQILAEVVDAYEKVHHPIPEPSPESAKAFREEQMGGEPCGCGHTSDETPGCGGLQCLTELRKDLNAALQAKDRHEQASYAVLVLPRIPSLLANLESMTWRAEASEGSLAMARGERNLLRKDVARLTQELEAARTEIHVWSGKACEEEQAAGNGPCGACRYCLPRQYDDLDIANLRIQRYEKMLANYERELQELRNERNAQDA